MRDASLWRHLLATSPYLLRKKVNIRGWHIMGRLACEPVFLLIVGIKKSMHTSIYLFFLAETTLPSTYILRQKETPLTENAIFPEPYLSRRCSLHLLLLCSGVLNISAAPEGTSWDRNIDVLVSAAMHENMKIRKSIFLAKMSNTISVKSRF